MYMKGVICYYSSAGNTRLACKYIARKVSSCSFDLFDIHKDNTPALDEYDVVGFATFTDFMTPSLLMRQFIQDLKTQDGKPAFVFNTFGSNSSGGTLWHMRQLVKGKGFAVFAGHTLPCPESFPPLIAEGKGFEDHPHPDELVAFNKFIEELDRLLAGITGGQLPAQDDLGLGFLTRYMPAPPRFVARWMMGQNKVDAERCTSCGTCERSCPYGAITVDEVPSFNDTKCQSCWACYNHCPTKAIYTTKLRDTGHYPRPNDHIKHVLGE